VCGILGVGGPGGPELAALLIGGLAHRGPDDERLWTSPELTLAFRRLAIIGLDAGGRQPRVSDDGSSVLVFNGEIYNYLEIADRLEAAGVAADRRYDTAVLLAALEHWGVEALPLLNGMFAFAWYRPAERRLLLARDRWGKKPLFWGRMPLPGGRLGLVFSSELRTFTDLPGGPPPSDALGIARYLVYDGMPGTRTVYRGVHKLPAAGWLEVDPEGSVLRQGRYWRWRPDPQPLDEEEATELLAARLRRAMELRLRSDVPVGLFLSGGIDSSLLAAAWRETAPAGRLRTFTVGFEDGSYDERRWARQMADAVGAEHHEIVVTGADLERELDHVWNHLSEPFADPSIVPFSLLCRFARREVTVAIGGDGGDELQAGYDPFRAWRPARILESLAPRGALAGAGRALERVLPADPRNMSVPFKLHHFTQGFEHPREERIQAWLASFPLSRLRCVLRDDLAEELDLDEVLEPTREAFRAVNGHHPLHAQIHTWIATYLECSILTKVDRASMMHSLEVRAPFLDPDLADLLARLPPKLIYRRGRGKVLLRRLAARRLPPELSARPKKGLGVPQTAWLNGVLRERMEAALASDTGWFRPQPMRALWREHLEGRADHRRLLWNFLFSHPFQGFRR
jgi:asparagine synthase (glutamine-hydrolysing)